MQKLDFRRFIDIVVGGIGLLTTWPVILIMVGLARFESGNPGLLKQTRIGLKGQPFVLYKIRNLGNDLTPLPFSRIFRALGLDELPQTINLLKGDMSLIGPRPLLEKHDTPHTEQMLQVRPGMTGLNGVIEKKKGVVHSIYKQAKIEALYVRNRTQPRSKIFALYVDMRIVFGTVRVMCTGRVDAGKHPQLPKQKSGLRIPRSEL